ncbi:MAG: PD-(D/E)XK nuclease family protein [Myxococcota bacterium]
MATPLRAEIGDTRREEAGALALKHEFAWSASRHANFRKCRRAHYYAYYLAWNGWQRSAPKERIAARTQHKLTGMSQVAGSAIHRVLAQYMAERPGYRMQEDEAVTRASAELRHAFKDSRDGLGARNPSKHAYLAEHFYADDRLATREATAEYGARFIERIRNCFANFYAMPSLALVREAEPEALIFVEDPSPRGGFDNFEYKGTKVFASPDLVLRDAEGVARIYDWKTGSPSDADEFQLLTYAIQAREQWGLAPEAVRAFDVYLDRAEVHEWEVSESRLAATEATIDTSIEAMRVLHFEADTAMGDAENFPRVPADAPEARLCSYCRFRRICGREEQGSEGS